MNEEDIIKMLNKAVEKGISRIKVDISDSMGDGEKKSIHHHGRCDVGSPFATGKLFNPEGDCR